MLVHVVLEVDTTDLVNEEGSMSGIVIGWVPCLVRIDTLEDLQKTEVAERIREACSRQGGWPFRCIDDASEFDLSDPDNLDAWDRADIDTALTGKLVVGSLWTS